MNSRPQTTARRPQRELPSCSLKPEASSLILDRSSAIAAKRALQSALARIEKVRADIIGSRADQLDHAQRDVAVAITLLRDADRSTNGWDERIDPRKIERADPSNKSASSARKGARA